MASSSRFNVNKADLGQQDVFVSVDQLKLKSANSTTSVPGNSATASNGPVGCRLSLTGRPSTARQRTVSSTSQPPPSPSTAPASVDKASSSLLAEDITVALGEQNVVKNGGRSATGDDDNDSDDNDVVVVDDDDDDDIADKQMALYEDDQKPFVSVIINKLANYDGGIVPNVTQRDMEAEPEMPESGCKPHKKTTKKQTRKLGTILGVFFPCVQNIFGVILFIRLVWVVGVSGWLLAFVTVFMCCCCTMTTSISMSAVATNGVVSGGGSYFMISRALGPEFGGAVGILFYLGTTVASSMYIVGAVEILLQYMAPMLSLFGPINIPINAYNNYRVYGSLLCLLMFICVFIGVKFVSKFSPVALFCVLVSILCVYIGIFAANPSRGPQICYLGGRLLAQAKIRNNETGEIECNKYENGSLYAMYCLRDGIDPETDADCQYFQQNNVSLRPGIPGLASGVFTRNIWNNYQQKDERIGFDEPGDRNMADIVTDITTSFVVLLGIFFPSVTGIMAGSNRSGDLADASRSIPVGTISAVAFTSTVYLSCLLFFAASVEGQLLRDKFGESMGGGLIVATMAWPSPWVILVGSFLSTCGAGLQSLTGAPRLLQAIAADGVIPFLRPFAVTSKKGEPRRALFLTVAIAECGVLLANVDYIAPIITMFFLMCYCFTNLACAVQTLLRTPNWRPRFRFYHWTLSLFGVCLCLALMFITSWYYALAALVLAAGIYKYIEYKGAEKEWGDGMHGLSMSAARFALLKLEEGPPHVKNWRPQLLILLKTDEDGNPTYRKLLSFSSQLKAGKGLTLVGTVIEGDFRSKKEKADRTHNALKQAIKKERVKGFAEVIVSKDLGEGLSYLVQASGVGGLRHNSVVLGWPHQWRQMSTSYRNFIDTVRVASDKQLAVMIAKGVEIFPENSDRMSGTIDVWWIVHDGGMLMLLPFLLTQHKVWRHCRMRIFTVAQMQDNSIQMKKDLERFIYHLRLTAEVQVVEMLDKDISAYTYERTLAMEQRSAMLSMMKKKSASVRTVDPLKIVVELGSSSEAAGTKDVPGKNTDSAVDNHHGDAGNNQHGNSNNDRHPHFEKNLYTFSAAASRKLKQDLRDVKVDDRNIRRMHTAVRLNEVIRDKSAESKLIILNLPGPPKTEAGEENYMEFLDVLTEGLDRVLMVRGGGHEVITIYS